MGERVPPAGRYPRSGRGDGARIRVSIHPDRLRKATCWKSERDPGEADFGLCPVSWAESPAREEVSCRTTQPITSTGPKTPTTIAEVLQDIEPMGDLRQFAIDDLTPEDEDEFFRILEDV